MVRDPSPQVLESRVAYTGQILDVLVETIRPASGERALVFEIVRHAPSVGIAATPTADTLMLVRQYRHAVGTPLWELPAGSIDPGETAEEAARRECQEELGLVAGHVESLGTLLPLPGYCTEEMTFFKVSGLRPPTADDPEAHQDEDEDIEARAFTFVEVREMVRRREIRDMKVLAVLMLLACSPDNSR
jgi:ADP-ribose pyrophosphatase